MNVYSILEKLISFNSVCGHDNSGIVEWIQRYLEDIGLNVTVITGPEGNRSNIFATLGPKENAGIILSGHMDVVPANELEWESDPFQLRSQNNSYFGRGTSDMKGFLACVLAVLPDIAKKKLNKPIHVAFSYDEELGCRGVPHMIAQLQQLAAKPMGCIVGEPSNLQPIRGHKGKAAIKIEIHGQSGHSSRPDLGKNAIHAMSDILNKAIEIGAELTKGPFDETFSPPYSSLQIGTVSGGQAVNIIPDYCSAELEIRTISGVLPLVVLEALHNYIEKIRHKGFTVNWTVMSEYPALSLAIDSPLNALVEKISGKPSLDAVSYGTEAGLFQQAGIDSIICGPGDISRAHKPNEYITQNELDNCCQMLRQLGEGMAI